MSETKEEVSQIKCYNCGKELEKELFGFKTPKNPAYYIIGLLESYPFCGEKKCYDELWEKLNPNNTSKT